VIVGGVCERDNQIGALRNTAVVVDPDGLRAAYRKVHLWDRESLVFHAGEQPPPVLDTIHGRIGVMVCYDLEFPEWVHLPALWGAELLCARSTGRGPRTRPTSATKSRPRAGIGVGQPRVHRRV
jgi:5-aminopentanamidase